AGNDEAGRLRQGPWTRTQRQNYTNIQQLVTAERPARKARSRRTLYMASGNPKPAFYLAVFAIVIGLVGLGLWRFGALHGSKGANSGKTGGAEMTSVTEAPDTSGITTAKEYKYVPAAKLPPVQGISSYKPLNDRTVHFAINVWAGWAPIILANNGFKAGKIWKTPGGQDFKVE